MRRICCGVLTLFLLFSLCACSSDPSSSSGTAPTSPSGPSDGFADTPQNGVSTVYPDRAYGFQLEAPSAGETVAVLHTSMGDISLRFFPEAAPKAVENFLTHARDGYYDGLTFHRILRNFMIQGGDPKGTGSGGESIWGGPFADEFDQKLLNLRGALSMANNGVNRNGSQFFINQAPASSFKGKGSYDFDALYASCAQYYAAYTQQYGTYFTSIYPDLLSFAKENILPVSKWVPEEVWSLYAQHGGNIHLDGAWRYGGGHTVFGQVFAGMDVVDAIAAVPVEGQAGKPLQPVIIQSITVVDSYAG